VTGFLKESGSALSKRGFGDEVTTVNVDRVGSGVTWLVGGVAGIFSRSVPEIFERGVCNFLNNL